MNQSVNNKGVYRAAQATPGLLKKDYAKQDYETLNIKGLKNLILCFEFTAILLNGWILPIGGVASGGVWDQLGYPS